MGEKLIRNEQDAIETIKSNMPTSGYEMLRESLDMAISALEKQIPEKVIDNTPTDTDVWYQCPSCKGDLTKIRGRYCGYCGKAIDRESCQHYTVEDALAKWGVDVNADIGEEKGNDKF